MKDGDMLVCPMCGSEFPYSRFRAKRKYCSEECQRAAHQRKVERWQAKHREEIRAYARDYRRAYDKRLKAMREQMPPQEKKKAVHGLKHGANISLSELARLAREEGMSYGYYVAKHGY